MHLRNFATTSDVTFLRSSRANATAESQSLAAYNGEPMANVQADIASLAAHNIGLFELLSAPWHPSRKSQPRTTTPLLYLNGLNLLDRFNSGFGTTDFAEELGSGLQSCQINFWIWT